MKRRNLVPFLIYLASLAGFVRFSSHLWVYFVERWDIAGIFISTAVFLVVLMTALILQIFIHEGGHCVFGRISGWQFVSFRIGKSLFLHEDGKIKRKSFNLPGTGGQCLMSPEPAWDPYDYPYTLYNLGGSLANGISALLALLLYLLIPQTIILSEFFSISFVLGMASMLENALPMIVSGMPTDGHNIRSLRQDPEARRALCMQLLVNAEQIRGRRLRDMPAEWFELPADVDLDNPMITALAVFKINYLHDKGDFLSAKELSESLLQHAGGLVPFHRHELASELLFYEIIGERRRAEIERLRTKELQEHLKQTAAYPSHKRLKYAYELLVNEDRDAAAAVYAEFEKIAREHPFPADTAAEQELIHEYIDKLALTGP